MRKVVLQKATGNRFHWSFTTWPKLRVTHEILPINDSLSSSMCFSRGLFCGLAVTSQVVKTTSSQILHQTLRHSLYIKSHKNMGK